MDEKFEYDKGVLGGTFDNFHRGHKFFIDNAFRMCRSLLIGITTDAFVKKKNLSDQIQDFKTRSEIVKKYLTEKNFIKRAKIIPISDIYGITLLEKNIDVIFTTSDTVQNSNRINEKRKTLGFSPIKIVKIQLQKGDDKNIISSTRIRMGEIDEYGMSFLNLFKKNKTLKLSEIYRNDFKKPIGKVISDPQKIREEVKNSYLISIGDVVTSNLIRNNIKPNLSLFDLKTKRETITDRKILDNLPKEDIKLKNLAGTIESLAAFTIHDLVVKSLSNKKTYSILIDGEEDLLTVPAILLAPINSKVIYGIRDVGAVIVNVTLPKKKEILKKYFSKLAS